jgi:GNAT superfamily N-acetyltransferase
LSRTDFKVRLAEPEDAAALRLLIANSVRRLQLGDYTQAQIDGALGTALGLDTQLIADRHYYVAEAPDGTIVVCGGWSDRKTLFGSDGAAARVDDRVDPAVDAAKIRAIFVHPEWVRQGLGSLILDTVEGAARAAGFRRFEMGSTLTGVALYTLRGYLPGELIEVPLPNGEKLPILKMAKEA